MHETLIRLADVWKTCNKIRSAVYRVGLNLWEWYLPLDPEKNCLISESKFVSILAGPLRTVLGLSEKEIAQLADYFKTPDGRILYHQLCSLIHGEDQPKPEISKFDSVLDQCPPPPEPECHHLDQFQTRRLCFILATIAAREIPLEPYFQDYELVAKNDGRITFAHFSRILNYIGVILSASDFQLIVRRFIKDSYTLDYIEFLKALEAVRAYGIQGLLKDDNRDKVFRPELASSAVKEQSSAPPEIPHPALKNPSKERSLKEIMLNVQKYVKERRLRVSEFFIMCLYLSPVFDSQNFRKGLTDFIDLQDFDPLNSGRISPDQFRRACHLLGLQNVVKPLEFVCIMKQYLDPNDSTKVCWRTFEDDCDMVFTVKELEKYPDLKVGAIADMIEDLPKPGSLESQNLPASVIENMLDDCEAGMHRIKRAITERSVDLRPFFKDHDHRNNGHISSSQLRRALSNACILLTTGQIRALDSKYTDDLGFFYYKILDDLLDERVETSAIAAEPCRAHGKPSDKINDSDDTDIVQILAYIKGKMVREGVRPRQFLVQFDPRRELIIPRNDFYRGLGTAGLSLNPTQMDTLMEVFSAPARRRYVEYERFCNVVGEALTQPGLERAPLLQPMQHLPTTDRRLNFLNFEERLVVSKALMKLAKYPDQTTNLLEVFLDMDPVRCGTIPYTMVERALCRRSLLHVVSPRELHIVAKCFGYRRGCEDEVDYRGLCNALDLIHATMQGTKC